MPTSRWTRSGPLDTPPTVDVPGVGEVQVRPPRRTGDYIKPYVVLKAGAAPNALSAKAHVRPVKSGLGRRAFQLPDGRWVIKDRYRQPDDQAAAEADKDVTVLSDAEFKAERRRVAASGGDD